MRRSPNRSPIGLREPKLFVPRARLFAVWRGGSRHRRFTFAVAFNAGPPPRERERARPPLRSCSSVDDKRPGAGEERERRRAGSTRARESGGRGEDGAVRGSIATRCVRRRRRMRERATQPLRACAASARTCGRRRRARAAPGGHNSRTGVGQARRNGHGEPARGECAFPPRRRR
jgi:hypothetical protein